ncbi:MAG: TetR family transcriptional regulator [Novosphingobium sp.]|nr:TetR family transcriptional regulator [Novosphingobium sp.]
MLIEQPNHLMRRRWIVDTTIQIVAKEGLEAATIRRLAREMSSSTSAITHYFASKDDLVFEAFRGFISGGAEAFRQVYARDPRDILGYLCSVSATNDATLDVFRAFMEFKLHSARVERFALETQAYAHRMSSRLSLFLKNSHPHLDSSEKSARKLMAMVEGIGSQRVILPHSWSPADVEGEFRETLTTLARVH